MEELRGAVVPGALPAVLRQVSSARPTGHLRLANGAHKVRFSVVEGSLTEVLSTLPGARLGETLVKVGFLSARDLEMSLELAALAHERLGETLLRHGILDADHLSQGLALQLREVMAQVLEWTDGSYSFREDPGARPPNRAVVAGPRVEAREVLLDATWTLTGHPAIDALLGDLRRKATTPRADWLGPLASVTVRLTPADAFLLSRVDGRLSGEDLLQLSPLPPEEARASLAGLVAVGAIEFVDGPAPASRAAEAARAELSRLAERVASSDPWHALGVSGDADVDTIRGAYLRLLRSAAPEAATDPAQRATLALICENAGRAYREIERRRREGRPALRAPTAPLRPAADPRPAAAPPRAPIVVPGPSRAPEPPQTLFDPSKALEAADQAFEARRLHEALAILHEAIPRMSGIARRGARVRRARILLATENGGRLAEEELKAALAEDPGNADAHEVLAGIHRQRGSLALAAAAYRKVLELQPRHAAAREALQEIQAAAASAGPATPAPESTVLQRIFKRPTS